MTNLNKDPERMEIGKEGGILTGAKVLKSMRVELNITLPKKTSRSRFTPPSEKRKGLGDEEISEGREGPLPVVRVTICDTEP